MNNMYLLKIMPEFVADFALLELMMNFNIKRLQIIRTQSKSYHMIYSSFRRF